MSSCALTGHRRLGADFSKRELEAVFRSLLEGGTDTFFCGMAWGFDLEACRILLELKREYPLRIVACIPYAGQSETFADRHRKDYVQLLSLCDEKIVLHEEYTNYCMFERDRYMVDRADVVVAYLRNEHSGTAYTVNYAKKRKKALIFV